MISIIIPIYNEEEALCQNADSLKALSEASEVIFVDGGSSDRSRSRAQSLGRVLLSSKGRAVQMNQGARQASGDIALFLHADCRILPKTLEVIAGSIGQGLIGGCLTQRIGHDGVIFRFIEGIGNFRARLTRVFYGDQAIFVSREAFLKAGGFPEVPIMEDVLLAKALKRLGATGVLEEKVFVSARRWQKRGILKTAFLYSLFNILFWLRVPLRKIKPLYADVR